MIKIRSGVFETNSSSTHSLTIVDKEDYDKWSKGEYLFNQDKDKFLPKEDAIKENRKIFMKYGYEGEDKEEIEKLSNEEFMERFEEDYTDYVHNHYFETYLECDVWDDLYGEENELFYQTYTAKNGTKIAVFGYNGWS